MKRNTSVDAVVDVVVAAAAVVLVVVVVVVQRILLGLLPSFSRQQN